MDSPLTLKQSRFNRIEEDRRLRKKLKHYLLRYFLSLGNNLALSSRQQLSLQSWLNLSNGINLEMIRFYKSSLPLFFLVPTSWLH